MPKRGRGGAARAGQYKSTGKGRRTAKDRSNKSSQTDTPWLYGRHAVTAAILNPDRVFERLVLSRNAWNDLDMDFSHLACQPEMLGGDEIAALLPGGAVHQGMAALVSGLPEMGVDDLEGDDAEYPPVAMLLDQVTDAGNIGAIIRSSAAFAASAVITTDRHAPNAGGSLAKSACGAVERIPYIKEVNLKRAIDFLKDKGYWVVGLDAAGEQTVAQIAEDFKEKPLALVLGAEGEGLRPSTMDNCDLIARLPITNKVESLNVSNAAAVSLYAVMACRDMPDNRAGEDQAGQHFVPYEDYDDDDY